MLQERSVHNAEEGWRVHVFSWRRIMCAWCAGKECVPGAQRGPVCKVCRGRVRGDRCEYEWVCGGSNTFKLKIETPYMEPHPTSAPIYCGIIHHAPQLKLKQVPLFSPLYRETPKSTHTWNKWNLLPGNIPPTFLPTFLHLCERSMKMSVYLRYSYMRFLSLKFFIKSMSYCNSFRIPTLKVVLNIKFQFADKLEFKAHVEYSPFTPILFF